MSLLVLKKNIFFEYLETIKSEKLGVYTSFFLHFSILLFLIGFPNFFESKPINIPTIIPIEIINIADITSVSKNIGEKKAALKKEVALKEKKFNSSNNQEIKKITIKDSSKIENKDSSKIENKVSSKIENKVDEKNLTSKNDFIIKEKKTISIESEKKNIIINENNIESLKIKKIKPKPKPKTIVNNQKLNKEVALVVKPKIKPVVDNKKLNKEVALVVKPKIKPVVDKLKVNKDVIVEVKPKKEVETEFNIASLLKDIRNDQISPKNEVKEEAEEEKIQKIDKSEEEIIDESSPISITEHDIVLQQLTGCFTSPVGSKIEETEFIKISAEFQRDRRIIASSIRIVDTNIGESNPFYEPLKRSAINTFLHPDCIPLKLPKEKYEQWKNITIFFDYNVMRGN